MNDIALEALLIIMASIIAVGGIYSYLTGAGL
jgi:hypothetical protein